MHAHLKAGWEFSRFVGEFGGWWRGVGDREQIVAREKVKGGDWMAYEVSEHGRDERIPTAHKTRSEAMGVFA